MNVEGLQEQQDTIVVMFMNKQQGLINEAVNIEYKLTTVEQGYSLADID